MEVASEFVKIQWVRPRRAAALLGCGLTKTYEFIADGRLVTKKVDGMRLHQRHVDRAPWRPSRPADCRLAMQKEPRRPGW